MMEQALNDPGYKQEVELIKKMKKRGIIDNGEEKKVSQDDPEDKAA